MTVKATEPARIAVRKGGFYRCGTCRLDFTVRTGTILEMSHVPLHKWLYSMYLLKNKRIVDTALHAVLVCSH